MTPIRDRWRALFAPRDRRDIAAWAEDNIELPSVLTIRGRFSRHLSRHFVGPLDALADDRVRQVVLVKPTRGGGSLIEHIWVCWTRMLDPGPAMVVYQDEREAEAQSETRLMPMLKAMPGVGSLLSSDRHRTRKEEVLFNDGLPLYVTGPAIGRLQSKGIRYMALDEAWAYKPGIIREAEARMGDFARMKLDKLLIVSQAGLVDDDLDKRFRDGDCCEWEVPCLGCGKYFDPRWSGDRPDGSKWGMRWDEHKDAGDSWLVRRCLPSVRYECPHCAHPHVDSARVKDEWNRLGRWTATNPEALNGKRSFHWRAIIDSPWDKLAEDFMSSVNALKMGVAEPVIQFFQKRMAEPKSEGTLLADALVFTRQVYDVRTEWKEERMRFLTADRQSEDLFWVMVRAWSKGGESRTLYYGKVYGFAAVKQLQAEWKPNHVGIDSGHMPKGDHGVYAACIAHNWTALRGDGAFTFAHHVRDKIVPRSYSEPVRGDPEIGRPGAKVAFARVVRFSSSVMSDRVRNLIRRGLWIEPRGNPADPDVKEYREQMAAEFKRQKENKFTGRKEWVWVCPSGNNHAFDCAKMQVCLATIAHIIPDTNDPMTSADTDPTADAPER